MIIADAPELLKSTITMTPAGSLRFSGSQIPWQQSLFQLGANHKTDMDAAASFWHSVAFGCVDFLCHAAQPDSPSPDEAAITGQIPFSADSFLDSAPPLPGGEYLNNLSLLKVWIGLLDWCGDQIRNHGGIAPFLEEYAPNWSQVGRIFFHLGENRLDNVRPFAFMVTYATGLNEKGQLRHTPLANALKLYANNRNALSRLLEPVYRASEKVGWVRALCDSGRIYQPLPWKPEEAYRFLLSAPDLEAQGIGIRLPDWWKKRPRLRIQTEISTRKPALGVAAMLDFDPRLAMGDEILDDEELEKLLLANARGLVLVKNQWIEADSEKLREAMEYWRHAKKVAASGELSFLQGMRLLAGYGVSDEEREGGEESIRQWSSVIAGNGFREILNSARSNDLPENVEIPGLRAQLRPYQKKGVAWLGFLNRLGLGACLADDMGLGKTIQVISLLLQEKNTRKMPALLVAPASLLANWKDECARFAPALNVFVLHPSSCGQELDKFMDPAKLGKHDLVITTYGICARLKRLGEITWSRIIADEAQNIKNSRTKQSIALRRLKAPARIALTGTPIENSANDLWALFDFLNPGLLGSAKEFSGLLKKMHNSPTGMAPLRRLTAPFILRRMKTDKNVIASLPDKTEVSLHCGLTREQTRIYQRVVETMKESLGKLKGDKEGKNARNMIVLQNLVLLKQICNHPAQAGVGGSWEAARSGKFQRVGELCSEIAARQERALVFTQFREIIAPLSDYLAGIFGVPGLVLHGGTTVKRRMELVNEFQKEDGPPFFILSLKAGGSGLNLTRASHVIHFDRWWNPAVEDQATDRAFRIGQKKNVLVHKCLTLGTLEEKIAGMLLGKKALSETILDGMDSNLMSMSDEEIMNIVSLDANSILE